jgi:hypothetical protein
MLVFIVIYQLTKFSLNLGLCVFVAIFKLFNFVVGHVSLSFYCHFDAHGNVYFFGIFVLNFLVAIL